MAGLAKWATSRQGRIAIAVVAIPIAGLLAGGAVLTQSGEPSQHSAKVGPQLIGEHSALGERRVDDLNATLASMGRVRGEHAGLSRTDYEAGAVLDGMGR